MGDTPTQIKKRKRKLLQLSDAIAVNLKAANLSPEVVNHYLDHKDQIPAALTRGFTLSVEDDLFDTPIIFPDPVIVPSDFNPDTCLETLREECKKKSYPFNAALTDAHFARVTTKPKPGQRFQLKLILIKRGQTASSDQCLARLKREKAIFAGAQGLALAFPQVRDKLPKGKWYLSFDKESALPVIDGYHRVPNLNACSDGDFHWSLGLFEDSWDDDSVLVCLCDW